MNTSMKESLRPLNLLLRREGRNLTKAARRTVRRLAKKLIQDGKGINVMWFLLKAKGLTAAARGKDV